MSVDYLPAQAGPDYTDWRTRAACLEEDPDLFFPDGERGYSSLNQLELARTVCRRCPVRLTCLRAAMNTGATYGMWGGTTPDERRSLRRRSTSCYVELEQVDRLVASSRVDTGVRRPLSFEQRRSSDGDLDGSDR